MKQLRLTNKEIAICAVLVLQTLFWQGCKEECPEVVQPDVREYSKEAKHWFPYNNLNELTFRIDKDGQSDTITLYKESYDSIIINEDMYNAAGDRCLDPYSLRYWKHTIIYRNENTWFKIETTSFAESITALYESYEEAVLDSMSFYYAISIPRHWDINNDSAGISDTVKFFDLEYNVAFRGTNYRYEPDSVRYAYCYKFGFIYFNSPINREKWYLLNGR